MIERHQAAQDGRARAEVNHPTLLLYHARLDRLETAVLTTFGEWVVIYIPATLAVLLCAFFVLRAFVRHGAEVQLRKMRSLHPEAFELFRRNIDPANYQKGKRSDIVKIAAHFRHFLESNGVSPLEKNPLA